MINKIATTGSSLVIAALMFMGDSGKTPNITQTKVEIAEVKTTEQLIKQTELYSRVNRIEKEADSLHLEVQKYEKTSIRPFTDTIREIQP